MNEQVIEDLLRKAPPVRTPAGLLNKLQSEIELQPLAVTPHKQHLTSHVFRRWLPALGFALWFLGCIVVLGIQARQIAELKRANQQRQMADADSAVSAEAETRLRLIATEVEQLRKDAADVQRLRVEVQQLRTQANELEELRAQNHQLRVELKSQTPPAPIPEEDFFAQAADRAFRVECVNNLKQVGLAARIWANDHGDVLPKDYDSMQQELVTDKITFCPADGRTRYEIISPGASETIPQVVYTRCPIHNNVGLCDGSVQQLGNRQVIQRDGKWVIGNPAQ